MLYIFAANLEKKTHLKIKLICRLHGSRFSRFSRYSYNHNKRHLCLFMKQNCHFDRGLAQYKHATPPLSFSGIITTLLGLPKRYITLVYIKGLKSYQPSKFKRVDFLSFYLVKRIFRLHFYWQLLSPLRYTKVMHLFGKPRSVVLMPKKLKGRVARLYCASSLSKWQFCFINRQGCRLL